VFLLYKQVEKLWPFCIHDEQRLKRSRMAGGDRGPNESHLQPRLLKITEERGYCQEGIPSEVGANQSREKNGRASRERRGTLLDVFFSLCPGAVMLN
jgi:hypothetical protein